MDRSIVPVARTIRTVVITVAEGVVVNVGVRDGIRYLNARPLGSGDIVTFYYYPLGRAGNIFTISYTDTLVANGGNSVVVNVGIPIMGKQNTPPRAARDVVAFHNNPGSLTRGIGSNDVYALITSGADGVTIDIGIGALIDLDA
jgi:hypothetical protein